MGRSLCPCETEPQTKHYNTLNTARGLDIRKAYFGLMEIGSGGLALRCLLWVGLPGKAQRVVLDDARELLESL